MPMRLHALGRRPFPVVIRRLLLDLDGTLHRLDDAGERSDDGVAPGVDDPPIMTLDQRRHGRPIVL